VWFKLKIKDIGVYSNSVYRLSIPNPECPIKTTKVKTGNSHSIYEINSADGTDMSLRYLICQDFESLSKINFIKIAAALI
jgi:hypothetical protein